MGIYIYLSLVLFIWGLFHMKIILVHRARMRSLAEEDEYARTIGV